MSSRDKGQAQGRAQPHHNLNKAKKRQGQAKQLPPSRQAAAASGSRTAGAANGQRFCLHVYKLQLELQRTSAIKRIRVKICNGIVTFKCRNLKVQMFMHEHTRRERRAALSAIPHLTPVAPHS